MILFIFYIITLILGILFNLNPFLITLFYFTDIIGLDGGVVYYVCRLLGTKANFNDHINLVIRWKSPLFISFLISIVLQDLFLLIFTQVIEILLFMITFKKVHKFDTLKSVLLSIILILLWYVFILNISINDLQVFFKFLNIFKL